MTSRRLAVVSAGLSQPSSTRLLADRLATASRRALGGAGVESTIDVVELREHAHDLTNMLLTGFASPALRRAIDGVVEADGLIAVTPIFTASYSGLFKTFFDVLDADALAGLPVLVGATAGTARHSLALDHAVRPMFAYLKALTVPTGVFAASEDWGTSGGERHRALAERVDRAAGELAELITSRQPRRRIDEYEEPTPFAELLSQMSA